MACGSITQRGDKYRVCFDYGVDREEKRVRKYRTFDTKRAATRAFNEHKVKKDRGDAGHAERVHIRAVA